MAKELRKPGQTSAAAASAAGKTLKNRSATATEKKAAASALREAPEKRIPRVRKTGK